jgi:UDP-N-acetylglucosamine 4,6-dehydratase/5-epimerase
VDIVVHAAALKQVCACEYNPMEAIKTNVVGTSNVIDACMDNGVEKAIFISTDKAVNPSNLYGATKLCAEKLFVQANSYSGQKGTKFSCSRYGNVAGSRGSVIPLFLEQKDKSAFNITDERMTRFLITLDQGVEFVINCLEKMTGGEIFVPKLPSIKIVDVAKAINPQAEIKIIGVRPGEKIHETLLTPEETRHTKEFEKYFVVEPEHPFWAKMDVGGKSLPDNFSYTSQNNNWWLGEEEIKEIIK